MALAATLRFRPRGALAIGSTAGTLAFNVASGVVFFVGLHQIHPFWAESPL